MSHDYLEMAKQSARDAAAEQSGSKRLCLTCAHHAGDAPTTCGLLRDEAGNARLTQPLRSKDGTCGPEGAFWRRAEATGASLIEFPKAGRFA